VLGGITAFESRSKTSPMIELSVLPAQHGSAVRVDRLMRLCEAATHTGQVEIDHRFL